MDVICTIPWKHLDAERVKVLLIDVQRSREQLSEAEKELRALGVSLNPDF
jgi:hypothetical protein